MMIRLRDILLILIATVAAAILLKAFVLDAVVIPSASMEGTLLPGDFVLVNKLSYSPLLLPSNQNLKASIPFTHFFTRKEIDRGDVVIFNFPGSSQTTLLRKEDLLVKRCVAKSGDIIHIKNRKIWVNDIRVAYIRTDAENEPQYAYNRFFPPNSDFSYNEYGPIRIPKKGDIIELNEQTFLQWERLIREEGHTASKTEDHRYLIDGKPELTYIVQKNYLFVLGDNYFHSFDSRFWGFLPEDYVIGEAACIYWSLTLQPNKREKGIADLFDSIRWDRVGKIIQ